MAKRSPVFSVKKIQELVPMSVLDFQKVHEDELIPIIELLFQNMDQRIFNALKNYFIIRVVTSIEAYFKNVLHVIIDDYDLDVASLFDKNEIIIPFSNVDLLKNSEITKGKIVASSFNFQDPKIINDVFSKLLKVEFFERIKTLASNHIVGDQNLLESEKTLSENWDVFMKIFEERNSVVHSLHYELKLTAPELRDIATILVSFMTSAALVILVQTWVIADRRSFDEALALKDTINIAGNEIKWTDIAVFK